MVNKKSIKLLIFSIIVIVLLFSLVLVFNNGKKNLTGNYAFVGMCENDANCYDSAEAFLGYPLPLLFCASPGAIGKLYCDKSKPIVIGKKTFGKCKIKITRTCPTNQICETNEEGNPECKEQKCGGIGNPPGCPDEGRFFCNENTRRKYDCVGFDSNGVGKCKATDERCPPGKKCVDPKDDDPDSADDATCKKNKK